MAEKELGVAVDRKKTQQAISLLDGLGLRLKALKPKKAKSQVVVPVEAGKKEKKQIEKILAKNKIGFTFKKTSFEKQPKKVVGLKEALKGKLSAEELEKLVASYNVYGDIAVIEIPDSLEKKKKLIGKALLGSNPQLKTVLVKSGETTGRYRAHPVKVLAGEKKTTALYKESGCRFKVELGKVFFSPRLATERSRISRLIKKGEVVAGLFAGVGPFPIVFAKNSKMAKSLAVELNPAAFKALKENIALNKVSHKVTPFKGDVKKVVPKKLKGLCDRVVMPLPKAGETFLKEAIQCLKPEGGIIHFYQFVPAENPFQEALAKIKKAAEQQKKKARILRKAKVRSFSPKIMQIVVDFKISPKKAA